MRRDADDGIAGIFLTRWEAGFVALCIAGLGFAGGGAQEYYYPSRTACAAMGEVVSREIVETQVGYIQREWTRPHCFDRPTTVTGGAHE